MEEKKTKKGFIKNYVLNTISFALITGTLQLVVYPYLSRVMSQSEYGIAVMLIGFTNLFTAVFAQSLNNVRFRYNLKYKQNDLLGDFKILFYLGLILNALFVFTFIIVYKSDTPVSDILLLLAMTGLAHFRIYFSIHYRLLLNFKKLLLMSVFVCLGYLAGAFLTTVTGIWQLGFVLGELAGAVYVYFTCATVKEPAKKTNIFSKTLTIYVTFIVMNIFTAIPMYADRLIIYPLLSSEDVAIYYVAVFYGKTVGAVLTPLAEVFMSYYSTQTEMSIKRFLIKCFYIIVIATVFTYSTFVLGGWITSFFYPNIIQAATQYLVVANIGIILYFAVYMLSPALVRFCSLRMLFAVRGVSAALYLAISLLFIKNDGLMGFCNAMVLVNSLTFLAMVVVGVFSLRKRSLAN